MEIKSQLYKEVIKTVISQTGKSLIKTILYFEIFDHPLNEQELYHYCQYTSASKEELKKELELLTGGGYVEKKFDFYFINNDYSIIEKRGAQNKLAEKYFKIAQKYSKLISKFPFVESILITGSLSKGCMDEKGDIDYFIITSPNRLWLCRSLLILFKKIFLLNSHKYFCVNYFVDVNNLLIPDRNIFTATEVVFAIPTYNNPVYLEWMKINRWSNDFYPNGPKMKLNDLSSKNYRVKRIIERLLKGKFGEALDNMFFRITLKHWKKKFKDFDADEFDLKLRSRKSVSKHHPRGFQARVLSALENKITIYEQDYKINL